MKKIRGQVIYVGPHVAGLGLQHGAIFKNGVFKHFYDYFAECPAFAELFVPPREWAAVNRELQFDIARNMRGQHGKFVALYQETQKWLAKRATQQKTSTNTGVKIKTHA